MIGSVVNKNIFQRYVKPQKKFKAIRFRMTETNEIYYLSATGKFVGLGHRDEQVMRKFSLPKFHRKLLKTNLITSPYLITPSYTYEIVNMVGCGALNHSLNLSRFLKETVETDRAKRKCYSFNAERFPAAYLYINGCTVKLFASGKYNIINAKCMQQLRTTEKIFLQTWISPYHHHQHHHNHPTPTVRPETYASNIRSPVWSRARQNREKLA